VPLAALTAWQSLFDTAQLQPGQRVLIHGGSGGVGHFAVQLAKWRGAYVFATASTKNQDLLRKLGVDEPIDYTQQRFEDIARKVDIVVDTLGDEIQERSWSVLKKGGNLVSLVQPPSEEKAKELGVRAALLGAQPNGAQLAEIAKIIDSGKLAPIIDRILPLSEARRAHGLSQSGHVRGKIVLRVKDQTSSEKGHNHDHDLNTNTHNLLSRFSADIASALNLMKKGINHDHTIDTCNTRHQQTAHSNRGR
jgi:NADPH:quinone reductase-like Zn-dependent oxidoreductase